ncbi:major facilitator superfamily domain-containing protein [Dendryphion nanum]|uniref:Major facilitator superfamily domain-containing protein n=1 Tax=Dendryphion nanum TaxID=256645 RepID=A0A9P9E3T2_9PLEO|nr:major facilitator superfamily domain-containing protein [Dendryphion nanum]
MSSSTDDQYVRTSMNLYSDFTFEPSFDKEEGELKMKKLSDEPQYITGWLLHLLTLFLMTAIFLATMESSITSTAVLDITNQLGGYEKSSWLFTAYMLTYCGFQMVWAKLSDITGRKTALLAALSIFTLFSGLCGSSKTLTELIMYRWPQGIGGCGSVAIAQLSFFELIPESKWPAYVSLGAGVMALAYVAGPLLGGIITLHGHWQWIFLLNAPVGAALLVGLYFTFPNRIWAEPAARREAKINADRKSGIEKEQEGVVSQMKRIDFLGSGLLIGATTLLATALQQAAIGYKWTSVFVLPLLVCSFPFVVAFLTWQWYITTRRTTPEPVFPWRFCVSRVQLGMILETFFVGVVFSVLLVQIPQRFMAVHGLSPMAAATRLLAFGAFVPTGSSIAAVLMGKPKIPPVWIILGAIVMQIFGVIFLSRLPVSAKIDNSQYGLLFLTGTGIGLVNGALVLLVPYAMEKRDLAVGTAAMSQFRVLGGLVGIAIATSVATPYIRSHLAAIVDPGLAHDLLERPETISKLSGELLRSVESTFAKGYNLEVAILIGFAVVQLPVAALMWTNRRVDGTHNQVREEQIE